MSIKASRHTQNSGKRVPVLKGLTVAASVSQVSHAVSGHAKSESPESYTDRYSEITLPRLVKGILTPHLRTRDGCVAMTISCKGQVVRRSSLVNTG